jgi:hypothetical protein
MEHRTRSTASHVLDWIQAFCVVPVGTDQGKRVVLTTEQREAVRRALGPDTEYVISEPALRAYLALAWLCGPLARGQFRKLDGGVSPALVWDAAGPEVRAALKRGDDGVLTCGHYGTRHPAEAAEA